MIDKNKKPSDLELAKDIAKWYMNKDHSNIVVDVKDHAVYLEMTLDEAMEHPVLSQKKMVVVKKDGKIVTEDSLESEVVEKSQETNEANDSESKGSKKRKK
jgi:hypothetical protein